MARTLTDTKVSNKTISFSRYLTGWTERDPGDQETAGAVADESEASVVLIAHPQQQMLGRRFTLQRDGVLEIGRLDEADIGLPEVPSVSRRHARLVYETDGIHLEDMGSTNGVFVNDQQISGRVPLASGDRFQVGAVHFKLLLEHDVERAYYETVYRLLVYDTLTETLNRRRFEEDLQREFSRAVRHQRPLSLILFDVDGLKRINDRYGHLRGDSVLKELAALCHRVIRPEQTFARLGGDEFGIICPETPLDGGATLAEKLRDKIASAGLAAEAAGEPATCSFGVAELGSATRSTEELYAEADRALYRSKSGRGNRVSTPQD